MSDETMKGAGFQLLTNLPIRPHESRNQILEDGPSKHSIQGVSGDGSNSELSTVSKIDDILHPENLPLHKFSPNPPTFMNPGGMPRPGNIPLHNFNPNPPTSMNPDGMLRPETLPLNKFNPNVPSFAAFISAPGNCDNPSKLGANLPQTPYFRVKNMVRRDDVMSECATLVANIGIYGFENQASLGNDIKKLTDAKLKVLPTDIKRKIASWAFHQKDHELLGKVKSILNEDKTEAEEITMEKRDQALNLFEEPLYALGNDVQALATTVQDVELFNSLTLLGWRIKKAVQNKSKQDRSLKERLSKSEKLVDSLKARISALMKRNSGDLHGGGIDDNSEIGWDDNPRCNGNLEWESGPNENDVNSNCTVTISIEHLNIMHIGLLSGRFQNLLEAYNYIQDSVPGFGIVDELNPADELTLEVERLKLKLDQEEKQNFNRQRRTRDLKEQNSILMEKLNEDIELADMPDKTRLIMQRDFYNMRRKNLRPVYWTKWSCSQQRFHKRLATLLKEKRRDETAAGQDNGQFPRI